MDASVDASEGAGEPIEPIERSAQQEEAGPAWETILAVLLVGTLIAVGVATRRRKKAGA